MNLAQNADKVKTAQTIYHWLLPFGQDSGVENISTHVLSLLHSPAAIRLEFFLGILTIMVVAERLKPFRRLSHPEFQHDTRNLALGFINSILLRLINAISPVAVALLVKERQWGLGNSLRIDPILMGAITIVLFDFMIYWQHRWFHRSKLLWRFHSVHHSDLQLTASTAVRFHPGEILISLMIKNLAVVVLGAPPAAVLGFEIILNGAAMFNHANISFPPKMERLLRLILVTPDMHRVHHSIDVREANQNFGFCFPWWDKLFKTRLLLSKDLQESLTIGISGLTKKPVKLLKLLQLPFLSRKSTEI